MAATKRSLADETVSPRPLDGPQRVHDHDLPEGSQAALRAAGDFFSDPSPPSAGSEVPSDPPGARTCPSCGGDRFTPLFRKDGYRYVACSSCGCASLDPLPPDLASLYGQDYFRDSDSGGYLDYEGDEPLHRDNARRRLEQIHRLRPGAPGALLDVGCAVGFFLEYAQRSGWSVAGVDVSAWARQRMHARFGIPAQPTLVAEPPSSFDVITMFQVLEHMPDPGEALTQAHRCLRHNGTLVIETWDRGSAVARLFGRHWQQVTPPSVVHLFTRKSLHALLERCGFQVTGWHRTRKSVSVGFIGNLLAQKHPRLLGPVAPLFQRTWLGKRALSYGLGDLITLSAMKCEPPWNERA